MEGGRIIDEDNKSALVWCCVCVWGGVEVVDFRELYHVTQVTRIATA